MAFSQEELEEMRRADEEIEEEFAWTHEELALSRELDRAAELAAMLPERRKIAEYQRQYYEANKDKIAGTQRWLKDARRTIGYSQRELSKLVGCAQSTIARLESGGLNLDSFTGREKLLEILGVEL